MKIFNITVSKISAIGLLLFLSILSTLSYSQTQENIDKDISVGKMKDRAKHAARIGDIYTSLFYYEEIIKKDTQNLDIYFQLAETYRLSRNYYKAQQAYDYIYNKAPLKYPFALYYEGVMQKMQGKYDEAKANLILFRKGAGSLGDKNFKLILNKEIFGCDSGMVYKEFPENVIVENPGNAINHPHTEFSPFLLDSNTLIFGSLRLDTLTYYDLSYDHYEKQPTRQIYLAEKKNDKWEDKGKYEAFNDPHMDMGNFVYSSLSNKYYFSKCTKNDLGVVHCKIYYTEKVNGNWTTPVALPSPINIEGYTATQPTIVMDTTSSTITVTKPQQKNKPDNKKNVKASRKPVTKGNPASNKIEYLYFISNRPGGKGGLDIWYTSYNSSRKQWAEPVNFAMANTSEMECTPFFHIPTQTFYFSSNGQTSSGGLDIFKMPKDGRRFMTPRNLSFPINSPQDDLGFMLSDDGKKGALVSNRPGGTPYFHETCCDDIYSFEIMPAKPFICTLDLTIVYPDTSNIKGQLVKIIIYDQKTKKETTESVTIKDFKYKLPLEKNHTYKFIAPREGYQKDTLVLETRDMAASDTVAKKLTLKPIKKEETISIINETPSEGKAFVLKDIQYETNQVILSNEAKAVLDSVLTPFLRLHPKDKVIISSHTDNLGSHRYNQTLSKQRAENVVKYLISKGIEAHRLQAKGFGEIQPIAPNENADGSDSPIGRGLNRRTEFLLIKPE